MKNSFPRAIHLRDYSAPAWWIDEVELDVSIADDGIVIVQAEMMVRRNESTVRRPITA
jgi:aminopeptidase N